MPEMPILTVLSSGNESMRFQPEMVELPAKRTSFGSAVAVEVTNHATKIAIMDLRYILNPFAQVSSIIDITMMRYSVGESKRSSSQENR